MMGGGGGGTSGSPHSSQVFLPPGQPEAAGNLAATINPLLALSANAGAGTPAGQNYPTSQNFVSNYLTGGANPSQTPFNDLLTRAFQPAYSAADYGATSLFPRGAGDATTLQNLGQGVVGPAQTALNQGFDGYYDAAAYGLQNNAYYPGSIAGALQGADLGRIGADQIGANATQIGSTINPLIQSGFDPQSALFRRGEQQLMDQSNVANAMSGVAGTPYGASVTSNALGNYDLNWQDRQLGRQTAAAGAAGQAGDRAGLLSSMAPGVAATSAALPSNAYVGQIAQGLSGLSARNQGAASGLANYGAGTNLAQSAFQGAQGLGAQGAQYASQFGAAPYNLGTGVASNALAGLTNSTNLGNNQFNLPNQEIGNLMQYMGLGQNASQISGQLQNQSFNQLAQGIGGGLSAANTLFGGSSGGGGLFGSGGLGGLFGGGGAGLTGAGIEGLTNFGGGGAALGIPDALGLGVGAGEAAGGGFGLAELAPLALSA